MGKHAEAIAGLNALLDFSPVDAEAWAELADIYVSQGLYSQAIFALEEVVVCQANSWNVRRREWNGIMTLTDRNRLTLGLARFSSWPQMLIRRGTLKNI